MRRLRVALVAGLMCVFAAPGAADAATAPTVPTNVTATVVNDNQLAASVDVAWTRSTDADGDAISYQVDAIEGDAVRATDTTASTVRLRLARGTSYVISVQAIDASGSRSSSSATVTVKAPVIPVRVAVGIRRNGLTRSCPGVAHACKISSRVGVALRVRAMTTAQLTGARADLTVLWRKPGATRFELQPFMSAKIASGSVSIGLARIVTAPGTWCVQARLGLTGGPSVSGQTTGPATCVKYFLRAVPG